MAVPARPTKLTPPPFIRVMGIFLGAFNLLALVLAIWVLVLNRRHLHEQARIQTMNLAEVLEENLLSTTRQLDQVLQAVKDEAEHDPRGPRLASFMEAQFQRSGLFATLQTADSAGTITHRAPASAAPRGAADQDFFLQLKQTPKAGLFISRPFRSGPDAPWNLTFARRLDRPDGEFEGVVFGHFPLDRLTRILAQVDIGRFGSVSLWTADHGLLARYPGHQGQDAILGGQRPSDDGLKAMRGDRPAVQFDGRSALDGEQMTYTMQRIDGPGFFLFVGLAEADYLRPWRHQAVFTITALLGLLSLTLLVGWQARSAWASHLADQDRLAAEETKYRLLAENVTNVIWAMDPEGRLT
jgi:PAS domain-containing protein